MASTALFEHSFYIGNYMSGILYGVELVMYFTTLRQLFKRSAARQHYKFFFLYSTALVVLLTIDISTNAVWAEQMWITFRDNPGVPTYIAQDLRVWYQVVGSTSVVAMVFLGDALLLYRLFIIWGSNYYIIFFPCIIYLAALALGIVELVAAFSPGGFFFGGTAVNFGVPYYSIAIGMNIIVTSLICGRLLFLSSKVKQVMGAENSKLYTGVAAILIESAAPYTLMGIVFLVPYARGSDTSAALGQVWAKLTCLSPQLIILRVVKGKAWNKGTTFSTNTDIVIQRPQYNTNVSIMEFADRNPLEGSEGGVTSNTTLAGSIEKNPSGLLNTDGASSNNV